MSEPCPLCGHKESEKKSWCVVLRGVSFKRGKRDVVVQVTTDRAEADASMHCYRATGHKAEVVDDPLTDDMWPPRKQRGA